MRFLLICPAALLLLAFVGERARAHPQLVTPKGDSLPPNDEKPKKDFIVIIKDKPPSPLDFNASSTNEVKELREKLAEEQAKLKDLEKRAGNLYTAISQRESEVAKLKKEKIALSDQVKKANRKLLENLFKQSNVRKDLDNCKKSGADLSGPEVKSLVEKEARRLAEKQRKSIELTHRLKYIRLISDLRQRIQKEVDRLSDQVAGPTKPSKKPSPKPSTEPLIETTTSNSKSEPFYATVASHTH